MQDAEVTIQLPLADRRPRGLFTQVARPLPSTVRQGNERLGLGVKHVPLPCTDSFAGPWDCTVTDEITVGDGAPGDKSIALRDLPTYPQDETSDPATDIVVVHQPFKVVDGLRCSQLSLPEVDAEGEPRSLPATLRALVDRNLSGMHAAEMFTGAASGNPPLEFYATDLGTAADVGNQTAITGVAWAIETWLASVLFGDRGTVILPVGLLSDAVEHGWVTVFPDRLETASGHRVMVDPGFMGDPDNPKDRTPAQIKVFGMGDIFFDTTAVRLLSGAEELTSNMLNQLAETACQIAYSPCTVGSVTVTGLSIPS